MSILVHERALRFEVWPQVSLFYFIKGILLVVFDTCSYMTFSIFFNVFLIKIVMSKHKQKLLHSQKLPIVFLCT